ncbi:Hsp90 co-chaperone Cdc37-like 1 [Acipenser ruthenus]|uniref:Hsp90 co-chaperone Cdc37-like 1 n=1 Tax=Acipenser ruthenus TaxID=7906 RepID=A0A662YQE3_ACIRT|nr:Hsp90 co-chaperone Cdc37-like 1 [Acipenser ruthenus]
MSSPNLIKKIVPYMGNADLMFKSQKQRVKNSIECKWHLAEAQQKLCSLELHNSESLEQEHAKAQADSSELRQTEQDWRHKEKMLRWGERQNPVLSNAFSREVFNKSFINIQNGNKEADEDRSKSFVQKYEEQLKHFGMLNRWDDSQRYLSDHSHLVCEETANYLLLWCFHLQADKKEALMEQVAHQAMAMQFILEMANSHKVDPRGCFRQFFQKAKAGEEGYLEAFTTELEAFKWRVKHCPLNRSGEISEEMQQLKSLNHCSVEPTEVMESLAPDLKRGFQLQDRQVLQNVQSNMNPQKEALMEQVAHQAMAMQFILEMANSHKVDPRGCFRQFFQKAKAGEEGYLEAFTTELEAFKWRVKHCPLNRSGEISEEMQQLKSLNHCSVEPTEVMESLAPDLKRGFQLQDRQVLQNVQSNMNPQVSEYYVKCCIDAGLWVVPTKEDTDETRMMETS